jgi:hypothetical protein
MVSVLIGMEVVECCGQVIIIIQDHREVPAAAVLQDGLTEIAAVQVAQILAAAAAETDVDVYLLLALLVAEDQVLYS